MHAHHYHRLQDKQAGILAGGHARPRWTCAPRFLQEYSWLKAKAYIRRTAAATCPLLQRALCQRVKRALPALALDAPPQGSRDAVDVLGTLGSGLASDPRVVRELVTALNSRLQSYLAAKTGTAGGGAAAAEEAHARLKVVMLALLSASSLIPDMGIQDAVGGLLGQLPRPVGRALIKDLKVRACRVCMHAFCVCMRKRVCVWGGEFGCCCIPLSHSVTRCVHKHVHEQRTARSLPPCMLCWPSHRCHILIARQGSRPMSRWAGNQLCVVPMCVCRRWQRRTPLWARSCACQRTLQPR